MKVETKDTNSLFEKGFVKYPFSSIKINCDFWSVLQKLFLFDILASFQKSCWYFGIFCIYGLEFHVMTCFSRCTKQFCKFVLGANLSK